MTYRPLIFRYTSESAPQWFQFFVSIVKYYVPLVLIHLTYKQLWPCVIATLCQWPNGWLHLVPVLWSPVQVLWSPVPVLYSLVSSVLIPTVSALIPNTSAIIPCACGPIPRVSALLPSTSLGFPWGGGGGGWGSDMICCSFEWQLEPSLVLRT